MGNLINEIIAFLKSQNIVQFVSVWNNQFDYIDEGGSYSFAMPSAFVELNNLNSTDIGGRFQGSDLSLVIHIGNDIYNSDNMEVNNEVFSLRSDLIKALSKFQPSSGSLLVKISEEQDYQHTNVYHYKLSYNLHWIDNTSVPPEYQTTPPTDLIINS